MAAPLRSPSDWGITFGVSAGQPVAAGDQQISDVAVMPLMKLTQHSLPPRRPLRASCSACSTPPSLHVSAQCASDLMVPQMHFCIIYFLVVYEGQGKYSVCSS